MLKKAHFFLIVGLCQSALVLPIDSSKSWPGSEAQLIAAARVDNTVCKEELTALQARKSRVCSALKKITGKEYSPAQAPSIALACSGGGCRAAIATLGALRGLEKIALIDTISYLATVSGSTWTAASWMFHDKDLNSLMRYLQGKLFNTFSTDSLNEKAIIGGLISKFTSGRALSLNDIWGALIADTFLGTDKQSGQDGYFSSLAPKVLQGRYPIPLFTSIIGETSPNYKWVEHTPFETGSSYLNSWIPATAFGKQFNNGISTDTTKEERLGYILGMCGSAYAINVSDAITNIIDTIESNHEIDLPDVASCFSFLPWGNNNRISPPTIPNFTYNLKSSPLQKNKTLTLVDAGLDTNLPIAPLLRRNIQIYIICDASLDDLSVISNEMRKVEKYAQTNGYKFPKIDYQKLVSNKVSVFADPADKTVPVVIYIPNFEKFATTKFAYTADEFNRVANGIDNAITQNVQKIYDAIALAMQRIKT